MLSSTLEIVWGLIAAVLVFLALAVAMIASIIVHHSRIRDSEKKFKLLFDRVFDAILIIDNDRQVIVDVNESACNLLGRTKKQLLSSPLEGIIPKTQLEWLQSTFDKVLSSGSAYTGETTFIRGDGRRIEVEGGFVLSKIAEGSFVMASFRDITERKKAEEALQKSEGRYQELFDSVMEGIGVVDENEVIRFCNPAYAQIFDRDSAEDIIGECWLRYVPENHKQQVLSEIEKRKRGQNSQHELHISTAKGENKVVILSVSPRFDYNDNYVGSFCAITDVSETKRLQEFTERAKRLETAGKIAGQVAHDFNNLLGPLVTYPDFIIRELPPGHRAIPLLNDIKTASERMADINQQLLTLSRRGHYTQRAVNINGIILQALKQIQPVQEELVIRTDLSKNLMNIKAGPSQIHRVILNLIENARDAMNDVGQLTIKTENFYLDRSEKKYGQVPRGEYVKLTISDTGCGIPPEVQPKIFDPFFSTKASDKMRGSGLGLSVVDAVVKDHNGHLDFQSSIGKGTSFHLYFPITRESNDVSADEEAVGGTESVLVVDDDGIQREVILKLLGELGYTACAAESGEKAVELLADHPHDLLLLDMVMPSGIDGAETYRKALQLRPSQKAIIVSGFSETERVKEALNLGAGGYMRKPLSLKAVAAAVRKELDRPSP
jgi:PAS domain S-box-containing protein